jgi:type I restriction enzyme S subunit
MERFDLLAEGNGNVPQLRRLILALAMRGRLIDESSQEPSSAETLARIRARREALVKEGKLAKRKALRPVEKKDIPPDCPVNCAFEWLESIAVLRKGLTGIQTATPGAYPLVVTSEARSSSDHYDFDGAAAIIPLVSSTGHGDASLKRLHYQQGRFALGSILCAAFSIADDLLSARFIYEYLTAFKDDLLVSKMVGTANVSLSVGRIGEVPVPIVAPSTQRKVGELMVLCDQLEAAQAERESRRSRLVRASLRRLNHSTASDVSTNREHVRFHLRHLSHLTALPEHIQGLRRAILVLALRGDLVSQDPKEQPAASLLAQISKERAILFERSQPNREEATAQKRKQERQLLPDGLPRLPVGWQWATLMQCCAFVVDCHNKTAPYSSFGVPLVRTTNVRNGTLQLAETKFVDERTYARWSARCEPMPGDIVITREAPMGEVGVVPPGVRLCLGQRMMLARLVPDTIEPKFMLYSLRDPDLMDRIQDKPVGATVQHIRVGGVETLLVPVPPIGEQRRIVSKLDDLMDLCNRLDGQLAIRQAESRRLLAAVLQQALASAA